jgi:hypothetical protein
MRAVFALFLSLLFFASCNEDVQTRTDSAVVEPQPEGAGDEQFAAVSRPSCWGTWNVELRTFIECPFVQLPPGGLQLYFNGGTKSVQTATMSSDRNVADPPPTGRFNPTYRFRVASLRPGTPGYPATPIGMQDIESYPSCAGGTNARCPKFVGPYDTSITDFYSSEDHATAPASGLVTTIAKPIIHFVASGGDPLVPFAPKLDADIRVSIVQASKGANATLRVTGSHDAYPGYCLKINGVLIYCYSSNALGFIPTDLAIPWKARTVNLTRTIAPPACPIVPNPPNDPQGTTLTLRIVGQGSVRINNSTTPCTSTTAAGTTCQPHPFARGTNVRLEAVPQSTGVVSRFKAWTGATPATSNNVTVQMTANKSVTASFCGGAGGACCTTGSACSGGVDCTAGTCPVCGILAGPCCSIGPQCNNTRNVCNNTTMLCEACGGLNQQCCNGRFCYGGNLACNSSTNQCMRSQRGSALDANQ